MTRSLFDVRPMRKMAERVLATGGNDHKHLRERELARDVLKLADRWEAQDDEASSPERNQLADSGRADSPVAVSRRGGDSGALAPLGALRRRRVISFTLPSNGERWNWPVEGEDSIDVMVEILDRANIAWSVRDE